MLWIRKFLTSDQVFAGVACIVAMSMFFKQGVISVSFITFCVLCLVNYDKNWTEQFHARRALILPLILYGLYVIWSFVGGPPGDSATVLVKRITLLLFPACFLVTGKRISQRQFGWILIAFLAACIACSIACYISAFYNVWIHKSLSVDTLDRRYYYLTYIFLTDWVEIPPIYLSMMANFAVAIVVYTTFNISLKWRIVLVGYLSLFIVLLASKIGIVCLVALLGISLFQMIKQRTLAIISVLVLVAFAVISVFTVPFLKERFVTSLKFDYSQEYGHLWNSNAYRMAIWTCSFETIERSPMMGFGTGRGQQALEETYRKNNFIWGFKESLNPHNEFLASALDIGIAAPLALLAMILLPMIYRWREGDWLTVNFLIIVLSYCLIEVILNRQKGVVFASFFYALLLWYPTAKKTESPAYPTKV
jgi:O-antigen ligase